MEISYRDLYEIIRENSFENFEDLSLHIARTYNVENVDRAPIKRYFRIFKEKWKSAHRMEARFEERNHLWLSTRITLQTVEACATAIHQGPSTSNMGRPVKSLEDCSEVTKRRKLREHNQNISTDLINQGLCQRYKSERQHEKASIVEAVEEVGPDLLNEMKNTIRTAKNAPRKFTAEEALSLFLDLGLSRDKYTVLRNELKKRNHDALPSYNKIIQARNKCLPEIDEVTSDSAKVPLQKLLDSTVNGILQLKTEGEIEALNNTNLLLTSKWGCDGSSGHSEYKQKLCDSGNSIVTDSNMFMVSMVPLRLQCTDTDSLLWKNPRPSSAHFCRPIKFQYLKETKELIKTEVEYMRNEINSLAPTKCVVHGREVSVFHKLHLTMLDGKVAQYLTDTISSSTCIICQKNPKDFGTASEEDVQENYEYGLSPLHARIRFMEFVLHISYDLSFKGEGIRNIPENKQKRQEAKLEVQTKFRNELGLIIDTPKQGFGSSNDGNTARRFFEYPCITSAITGIDVGILQRFKTILNVLSCGASVDADKFGIYAAETEQLIAEKYPWRRLTATVHKVLRHGKNIILHHIMPIGELSEEAQEAKNKNYKYYRYHNTRKISRREQNQDLMTMLLVSSDPYISSFRRVRGKKDATKMYPPEMVSLLHAENYECI